MRRIDKKLLGPILQSMLPEKLMNSQISILCAIAVTVITSACTTVPGKSSQIAAAATQGADSVTDEELSKRVQAALHSDPYFYDEHVSVSVERGNVVLRGFVFSDWDLRDAIRIASQAAGERPVVDNLSIKLGGRRS
jgi:osmotically-inducible protein OsmY